MAKIKYIGPHDAVRVPLPLGGEEVVERGGTLKTSDEHAANLALQESWHIEVEAPKKSPSAKQENTDN